MNKASKHAELVLERIRIRHMLRVAYTRPNNAQMVEHLTNRLNSTKVELNKIYGLLA